MHIIHIHLHHRQTVQCKKQNRIRSRLFLCTYTSSECTLHSLCNFCCSFFSVVCSRANLCFFGFRDRNCVWCVLDAAGTIQLAELKLHIAQHVMHIFYFMHIKIAFGVYFLLFFLSNVVLFIFCSESFLVPQMRNKLP